MKRKTHVPPGLWSLAREQEGMLTHAQVTRAGFTRTSIQRLFDDKAVWRIARGLYSLTPDPTWDALAFGGVLLGGPFSVLGLHAAGFLHGLCSQPQNLDVFAPRRMVDRKRWRFHIGTLKGVGSPARTTIEVTALLLCGQSRVDEAMNILARAVSDQRTTPSRLFEELALHPNLRHRGVIAEVLQDVAQGAHSALEARYLHDVERAHGLPIANRQVRMGAGAIVDCTHDEQELVIELDGRLGHTGTGRWRDYARDNRHALRGWTTLRFGWADVAGSPCRVAGVVASMLRRLGWAGQLSRCSRCGQLPHPVGT